MLLIKLKTILQSKYLYYVILFIAIIYTLINVLLIDKVSLYDINEENFVLKIVGIKNNQDGKTITLKGKEKVISFCDNNFLYQLGDVIKVKGTLSIPSKNTIPNLFNYRNYLYNQDIFYILNIEEIELIKENNNVFYKIKTFIINMIDKYKSKNYLHAFILGNTSYIDDSINNKYLNLGINHLFAISGMHVSLLITILTFLLNKLKFNKYIVFIFNSIFLIIYSFLINFQVSIIRSILSYILLSINKFAKLNVKSEYILILIFSLSLLLNPFNINNIGFQYSYLISFVLIKYNALIKGNYFKKMFLISFLAFISSIPITIMNNYQINLLTVFYNMIYVPLISIIIFPCSLLCIVLPFLDNVFYYLIFILEKMTVFISDYSIILILKKPTLAMVILYFVVIFYCLNSMLKRKYYKFIYLIILLLFHYNINYFVKDSYLIMLDVGQGDCLLIHDYGQTSLIDTGGSFYKSYSDDLIEFMKSKGIKSIQNMIITHGDFDHMGEAIDLVNDFKVEKVIFNNNEFNELELKLIEILKTKKIPYYQNIKELSIHNNKLYFLNNKIYNNENDNSNIIYTEFNGIKLLLMGDVGVEVENDILENYNLKGIDILKAGHHGSKTSSSKKFINSIEPKYSIIGVGKNNRYGHPNNEVLENLENSKIYRTDIDGSIMFKIKNNKLEIENWSP